MIALPERLHRYAADGLTDPPIGHQNFNPASVDGAFSWVMLAALTLRRFAYIPGTLSIAELSQDAPARADLRCPTPRTRAAKALRLNGAPHSPGAGLSFWRRGTIADAGC